LKLPKLIAVARAAIARKVVSRRAASQYSLSQIATRTPEFVANEHWVHARSMVNQKEAMT